MLQLTIHYQIYTDHNVYIAQANGDITFENLYQHVDELMDDPAYYTGINAVYDFTKVRSIGGYIGVFEELANDMSDETIIDKQANTSIVLNSQYPRVKQMMEGYLLMTSNSQIDFRLFDETEWQDAMTHARLNPFPDIEGFISSNKP